MNLGSKVSVIDYDKVINDPLIEDKALEIIIKEGFIGYVSKIFKEPDGDVIFSVGFKNELGWVTQGFKAEELKEVK